MQEIFMIIYVDDIIEKKHLYYTVVSQILELKTP